MVMELATDFIEQAVYRLDFSLEMIGKCFAQISEEEAWKQPNTSSNSIGTLIVHLCGNITQYIISSLGGNEDKRERDKEFATHGGYNKAALLNKLTTTLQEAKTVIRGMNSHELLKIRSVQGYQLTGTGSIVHVVEHLSYHTGQIALLTKLFVNKDLAFYAGVDLNVKNV
jgi:uncharacterized damage-inducible protein DinB